MWGVILKLATGRYLFKPSRDRKEWNQDEDHLLLITELVGELPRSIIKAGFQVLRGKKAEECGSGSHQGFQPYPCKKNHFSLYMNIEHSICCLQVFKDLNWEDGDAAHFSANAGDQPPG